MASFVSTTEGRAGRVCKEWGPWRSRRRQRIPAPSARSPPASLRPQEGVTSQTSPWSRLYFMTFYIVTMVGRGLECPPSCLRKPPPHWVQLGEEGAGDSSGWALGPHRHSQRPIPLPSSPCAWPGGDDHHCGLHPRSLCLPNELQPQEPGLRRSVQASAACCASVCPAVSFSAVCLSSLLAVLLTSLAHLS